jgi:hypothetical protein
MSDWNIETTAHKGPAKLTLEWEVEGKKCTMSAMVKDPTILTVSEWDHYYTYDRVYQYPKQYFLEFDKLKDDGTVYQVQVTKPFKEIRKVLLPELTAKNMVAAAEQLGVDKMTKWGIEEYEGQFMLTPEGGKDE